MADNKNKKSDNRGDVIYSKKRDEEADIREIFISRETERLCYKVAIGDIRVITTDEELALAIAGVLPGPQGPMGPGGIQGIQGLDGTVGPAGLTWQGAWVSASNYVVNDAVGYGGSSWFCIADIAGGLLDPSADPGNWALLASQGATGLTGVEGPVGPQGPIGGSMPYLVYTALLNQTGTNDPVVTVLQNNLGFAINWTRLLLPGRYRATSSGSNLLLSQTFIITQLYSPNAATINLNHSWTNMFNLDIRSTEQAIPDGDNFIASIEIRVYP